MPPITLPIVMGCVRVRFTPIPQTLFRRKGLFQSPDCVSGFLLTAIVVHLVQRGTIVSAMSLHQATRAAVQFLGTTDLRASSGTVLQLTSVGKPCSRWRHAQCLLAHRSIALRERIFCVYIGNDRLPLSFGQCMLVDLQRQNNLCFHSY